MEPKAPQAYQEFIQRFPQLARAWEMVAEAGSQGIFSDKTRRLIKLALAIGAHREGAIRANVRKALAKGITREEIEQIMTLAAGTIGFPATVAVFTWVKDLFPEEE